MDRVFLLLGTNLGDRLQNLDIARRRLAKHVKIIGVSSVYESEAWGKTNQPEFYNQVLEIATGLEPHPLLKLILDIEAGMGRKRLEKWGQRLIDIDLLLYGNVIISSDALMIPHSQMQHRRFTLMPLSEIAADVVHPVLNEPIAKLLDKCSDHLMVRKISS